MQYLFVLHNFGDLVTQGAQKKINIVPPPRIKAIMAKIVHTVEAAVTRADNSLLAAGKPTTSSVLKPNLLVLLSKNLRRRDAFSQDILDVLFYCTFQTFSNYVPLIFIIIFKSYDISCHYLYSRVICYFFSFHEK
ncbi:uncharacterized protein LOC122570895 [Bombus pyrosoma]|uniref:uncharacterized protein LOC122570895 n=1 Tax=Bombus pyrosoma TaxID=396416 RepID=UPI001CB998F7|nr:uncharacterized protein LOC122570895 [Bombus pyrosoma]